MTETRQHKIDRIYEVIKPTIFWNTDLDSWHSNWDIKCVMIWDVLDWIEETRFYWISDWTYEDNITLETYTILMLWSKFRKPLEEQSDDTIDYLYSLLPQDEQRK